MNRRSTSLPARPLAWQPLVSAQQWAILAHAFRDAPDVLGDLRVVLEQLSPGVRAALLGNLMQALAENVRPTRAVWRSLAITGHEVKLCSAAALGRLHALDDDADAATVTRISATEQPTRGAAVDSPPSPDVGHQLD